MSESRKPVQRFGWLLVVGLLGLCFGSMALFSLSQPINVLAYWLGYGDARQVEVTKGSSSSSFGRGEPGEGRVVADGSTVLLYGADTGDTLTAHPRLITLGGTPYVYHSPAQATEDLVWLIPTALFGAPFALMLLAWIAPDRAQRITQRLRAFADKQRSPPADR